MTPPLCRRGIHLAAMALLLGGVGSLPARAASCTYLQAVDGVGVTPVVTRTISGGNPPGHPSWATAFSVTRPFSVFRFIFTVASSVSATYPIQGELQFSDGSRLQVINESLAPQAGPGRQWDAPAVPGKTVSQVTFRIGPSHDPAASGFTYRIAVQGCD